MPDDLPWSALDRAYITPKELLEIQVDNAREHAKISANVSVLRKGQIEMKVDVKEIKEVVMEQRIKKNMVRKLFGVLLSLPKTAKVVLLIATAIGLLSGAGAVVALG